MTQPKEVHKSECAKLLQEAAANRPLETIEIGGFFGLAGNPVAAIKVRVPLKIEQDASLDEAYKYALTAAKTKPAQSDNDLLLDAKHACVVWSACRDVNDPELAAFPAPEWMCANMTTDQIGVLLNLVNAVRAKYAPQAMPDDETMAAAIAWCAEFGTTDMPDRRLAGWPREVLLHAFVLASMRVARGERENAWLQGVLDHMREHAPEAYGAALVALGPSPDAPQPGLRSEDE